MTTFQKLNDVDKELALAVFSSAISELKEDDFLVKMNSLITKTHLKCGFPLDSGQVSATIRELCDDIKKLKTATFEEIEIAFKNGYKGEYGEFYGLNNRTYFFWIGAFYTSQNRARIKKLILESRMEKVEVKKSPEEIKYILKDGCIRAFDDFRKGAVIRDAGNVKYNYLVKHNILNFTKERKDAIYERTKVKMKEYAIESKLHHETIENALKKLLPEHIVFESRREALVEFFKDLVETETELKDLFDEL